jgi:hypothetical protein
VNIEHSIQPSDKNFIARMGMVGSQIRLGVVLSVCFWAKIFQYLVDNELIKIDH